MPKKKGFDIPVDVAAQIVKDAEAQQQALQPIKTELDKLPAGHSKEDAFGAFLMGLNNMLKNPNKP